MKLIIDIPEEEYKHTCEMRLHNRTYYDDAIRKGTPFDSGYYVKKVQNVPEITNKYIVARLVDGVLWYWGSWKNFDDAFNVAVDFPNGIVIERIEGDA